MMFDEALFQQREGWPAADRIVPRPRWQGEHEAAKPLAGDRA